MCVSVFGKFENFAQGFPFGFKLSADQIFRSGGKPLDARKIFINDNTNGVPEEDGKITALRLDFLYRTNFLGNRSYIFGGVRYSEFCAEFLYVGGNEDFEVRSNQIGFGIGLEGYYRISNVIDLVLSAGVDTYLASDFTGHDSKYKPDNDNINDRKNYKYKDADDAVNQPKNEFRILLGLNYNFE